MPNVTIFDKPGFTGASQVLAKGRYDTALGQIAIGNDAVSSLKVPVGAVARLFEHYHFQGRFIDIRADTPALDPFWNDRTSSIVIYDTGEAPPVTKEVMIFEHANYGGKAQVLPIGRYDTPQLTIGDNVLSSALVPYGMVLRLFENSGFGGASLEIREDAPAVTADWNDRASSGVVEEAPIGFWQFNARNVAIIGESVAFNGVRGIGHAANYGAVVGLNDNRGPGVQGRSDGVGVWGESTSWHGVFGHSQNEHGVWGESDSGSGIVGIAKHWHGVYGETQSTTGGSGVWGEHKGGGTGVVGLSSTGIGLHGKGGRLAGYFEGDVEVTGDIRLINADCAERFTLAPGAAAEPGTVMVLDDQGALRPGDSGYDKRVAGVVSGAGAFRPGLVLDESRVGPPIAMVGKVFCKVDAAYGAVDVGDLLTTSATPGHAMKSVDSGRAFGAVLGKALQPLREGRGVIAVLVALQ